MHEGWRHLLEWGPFSAGRRISTINGTIFLCPILDIKIFGLFLKRSMANRAEELDPDVCCIDDLKSRASVQLPQMYRGKGDRITWCQHGSDFNPSFPDYYNEGPMDLLTYAIRKVASSVNPRWLCNSLRDNEAAFDRYKIRPKILVDVNYIDTSSELFGTKVCLENV